MKKSNASITVKRTSLFIISCFILTVVNYIVDVTGSGNANNLRVIYSLSSGIVITSLVFGLNALVKNKFLGV